MFAKSVLVVCAQALLVQTAFSRCAGGLNGLASGLGGCNGLAGAGLAGAGVAGVGLAGGCGAGYGCGGVASTGGGLPIASVSPIAPIGVSVLSENAYEGVLSAGGNLPFLGTVGIEGLLPTAGAGAVSYGCGNGAIGISGEGPIATGIASGNAYPPSAGLAASGIAGYGLGGIAGNGLGGIGGCGLGGNGGYGLGGIAGNGLRGRGCGCGAY